MSKWLITGDWQADFKNLSVCYQAHGLELHLAKTYKVKGVIDLGDLKEVYDPVGIRITEFQVGRWQNIKRNGFESLALLGNHDRIGQYSDHRNWFGIFKAIGVQAVDAPLVVEKETVVFACLPYMHKQSKLVKAAEKLWEQVRRIRKPKVLLFHCDVKEAQYSQEKSKATISTKNLLFHKYDWCFGGHIHGHQMLGKNGMYVGNPFCCDWGEINQEKGFVLYDDETNKWERVKSSIPGWYSFDYLKANKVKKVADGTKIRVTVDCSLTKDYYKKLEQAKAEVEAHYPGATVYAMPKFLDEEDAEVVVSLDTSDYTKVKSYVGATLPKHLDKRKGQIVEYLAHTIAKVTGANVRSQGGLRFLDVEAHNVLSYKHLKFSYENRGVCLVRGINKDWPKHSNGAGKTNLLSMLPIGLGGQTFKEQKSDEWMNEVIGKKALLSLRMEDEVETPLKIVRGRRPVRLKFFIDGKDESTGMRHNGKKETQGIIEDKTGFTISTLKSSVYIDSTLPRAFLEGTPKDRAAIISRFQNLERFKVARDLVVKDLNKCRNAQVDINDEINIETLSISENEKRLDEATEANSINVAKIEARIHTSKQKLQELQKKYALFTKKTEGKYTKAKNRVNYWDAVDAEADRLNYSAADRLHKCKRELERALEMKERICPVCKMEMTKEAKRTMVDKLTAEIARLKKLVLGYLADQEEARAKLAKHREVMKKIEVAKDALEESVSDAEIEYKRAKEALEDDEDTYTKKQIRQVKRDIEASKRRIDRCEAAVALEKREEDFLDYCIKAFSREGIPMFLNGLVCPLLNKAASNYSKMFTDGEIQVRFDLTDGELSPRIINAHGSSTIKGQSAGEKAWAGFIASLALRETAPKTNLLILDEPGYGLDQESVRTLGRKLKELGSRFETVLVCTHNTDIESELDGDNTITVVKENKTSSIK